MALSGLDSVFGAAWCLALELSAPLRRFQDKINSCSWADPREGVPGGSNGIVAYESWKRPR